MTTPAKMRIDLTKAEDQGWQIGEPDGTTVRIGRRFEPFDPLSYEDGGDLFHCGMTAVEVFLECEGTVVIDTVFLGEFTHCSGRAIGGRAPAWIFPGNPLDKIEEEELPDSVRKVISETIQSICE